MMEAPQTMEARHRRTGAVVAVATVCAGAALTALTATGCSGSGAVAESMVTHNARSAVREAADVLAASGTSRTRTSVEMISGGTRVAIRGVGRFDYGRRMGTLTVTLPGDSGRPAKRRPITELVTPGALHMKNRGAGVPADKWVRVDTTTLPDGNLITAGATDPVSAVELLRGARKVTFRGEERWGGETVRHYRGTADIAAAARAASPEWRQQLSAAARGFSGRSVPFDVYLDDEGRVRKVQHRFAYPRGVHEPSATAEHRSGDRWTSGRAAGGGSEDGSGYGSVSGAGSRGLRNPTRTAGTAGGATGRTGMGGREGEMEQGRAIGHAEDVEVISITLLYAFGAPVKIVMPDPQDIYSGTISGTP